jgi:hypothetical protein
VDAKAVELACYKNALQAYGKSGQMHESDWLNADGVDQRDTFAGNSILRGGREPYIEAPKVQRMAANLIIK